MKSNNITLVFVNFVPMSRMFGEKMALSWFEERGFSVQLWDCASLYYDKHQLEAYFSDNADLKYRYDRCLEFDNKCDLAEALKQLPENTFVYHLARQNRSLVDDFWFLKLLADVDIPYAVQQLENPLLPAEGDKIRIVERIHYLAERLYPWSVFQGTLKTFWFVLKIKLKEFVYRHSSVYAKPALAFGVGDIGREAFAGGEATGLRYVSIPSPNILWSELKDDKEQSPIVLFVDESIGHAPDAKLGGYNTTLDQKQYYANMKKVFTLLEEYTGCPVVVGASGKVIYNENPFERKIVYKQTLKLSSRAVVVVGHSSSALYQSLCAGKPILLLEDPTFSKEKAGHVKTFATGVGLPYFDSTGLDSSIIDSLGKQEGNEKLIENLFKEKGIEGDYRRMIADSIEIFMEQRSESASASAYRQSN